MSHNKTDHRAWYNHIAAKTGGYLKTWSSIKEGASGEDAFISLLFSLLKRDMQVLDAGCGSGEFTLSIAPEVEHVIGFDFAETMIEAAKANARQSKRSNVTFIHATTHDLPFAAESFDLIYSRRGPTSILLHPEVLKPGGWMLGIHSGRLDVVCKRLRGKWPAGGSD